MRAALHANPLVAGLVLAALPGLPLVAVAAGSSAAPALGAAAADATLARGLALAFVVAAATVGIAVASLAPTLALLGGQLEPAPLRADETFVGLTLLPAGVFAAPLTGLVAAFSLTATAQAGGRWAGSAIVVGAGAAAALGAAAAESALGACRRSGRAVVACIGVAAVWLATGLVGGSASLGPAAPIARAARDPAPILVAALGASALVALLLWAFASITRPRASGRRASVRVAIPATRRAALAVFASTVARLVRNVQARRHVAAGLAFASCGALGLRAVLGKGSEPYFAASVALLVAAVIPLIAAGLRRDGAWLLRVAPVVRSRMAAADAAAAVVVGGAVIAATLAATAPVGRLSAGALLMLEATAALVLGASVATGAVLPWRADRVLEQLASYALLAVVTGSLTYTLGRAAGAAHALGLSNGLFAALAAHCVLLGGIGIAAVLEE